MPERINCLFAKPIDKQGTRLVVLECLACAGESLELDNIPGMSFTEVLLVTVFPQECSHTGSDAVVWDSAGKLTFGSPVQQIKRLVFAVIR